MKRPDEFHISIYCHLTPNQSCHTLLKPLLHLPVTYNYTRSDNDPVTLTAAVTLTPVDPAAAAVPMTSSATHQPAVGNQLANTPIPTHRQEIGSFDVVLGCYMHSGECFACCCNYCTCGVVSAALLLSVRPATSVCLVVGLSCIEIMARTVRVLA